MQINIVIKTIENFEKIRKQSSFSKFSKRSLKEKSKEWGYSKFSLKLSFAFLTIIKC